MQRLTSVHPSDLVKFPNGRGTISLPASNAGTKIVMYNETPLNIDLDFLNGTSDVLHAWEANYWTLDGNVDEIDWNIDVDSLNVTNPPINAVFLTIYQPSETIRDKTYPMALVRQLGGQQAIVSSASQTINDGNALQQVVEATLQGHLSSDVIINNDGSYTLKGAGLLAAVGILTHILGTLTVDQASTLTGAVTAPAANVLGAVGVLQHILGTLTVDQLTTLTGGAQLPNNVALSALDASAVTHNILSVLANNHVVIGPAGSGIDQVDGSGNIILRTTSTAVVANKVIQMPNNVAIQSADSGGTQRNMLSMDATNKTHVGSGAVGAEVRFDDSAGTQMGWFNSGGGGNVNGTFQSPRFALTVGGGGNFAGFAGTLSRFTFFTGSGSGTYSHTQGVTPQWVAAICNVAGSFTQGFDTPTSTQVHITCGAALAFTAMVMNS